jgi:hypothetical protein
MMCNIPGMTIQSRISILQCNMFLLIFGIKKTQANTMPQYIHMHRNSTDGWPQPSKTEHHRGGAIRRVQWHGYGY